MRRGAEPVRTPLPCLLRTIEPEVMPVLWVHHQGFHGHLWGVKSVSTFNGAGLGVRAVVRVEGCRKTETICSLPAVKMMRGISGCRNAVEEHISGVYVENVFVGVERTTKRQVVASIWRMSPALLVLSTYLTAGSVDQKHAGVALGTVITKNKSS